MLLFIVAVAAAVAVVVVCIAVVVAVIVVVGVGVVFVCLRSKRMVPWLPFWEKAGRTLLTIRSRSPGALGRELPAERVSAINPN